MKTIVLLHGALGSEFQMIPLKKQLEHTYHVHTFNFEGHGGRANSGEYSIDRFVRNVLDYLNEKELEKVSIFGYSMGGYVALKFAANYPERIEKVATLATKFDWNPQSSEKEVKMLNPEVIETKVPKFADHLKYIHSPLNWKDVLHETANMMIDLGNGKGLKENELKSIQFPVMIGIGDQDNMVSIEETKHVSQQLPNASLKIFKDFPHPIDRMDIQRLAEEIIKFIA